MTLAFVIPWYGENIGGGAEAACRMFVKLLQSHGRDVEVLTTCVRDFRSDWSTNYHPAGVSHEAGVLVRRFPVRSRDTKAFDAVNCQLMSRKLLSPEEEECFFREMVNSEDLYKYIEQHRSSYIFVFLPYMFGTTVNGSELCPEKSIVIPCLHDESYARLNRIGKMLRSVQGVVYLSPEEKKLSERLYGLSPAKGVVAGVPVSCDWTPQPARFSRKYGISSFLLYAGRTDAGKNAELLVDHYRRYVSEHQTDLKLVFIGGAKVDVPADLADRIVTLGFLPPEDKYDCYGASLALCVPSVMESFSIVMMESWLAGRPVIVNAECAVTTDFCKRSNGGLYFEGYEEFSEVIECLSNSEAVAHQLGQQGRDFVRKNFTPDIVAQSLLKEISRAETDSKA